MRLPWDTKYLKISFHVIFTLIVVYILKLLVDFFAYLFTNFTTVLGVVNGGFSWFFSILSPLLIALVISYLLNPIVNFFQLKFDNIYQKKIKFYINNIKFFNRTKKQNNKFKRRTAGTILTYVSIILIISLFATIFIVKFGNKDTGTITEDFVASLKKTANDLDETYKGLEVKMQELGVFDYMSSYLSDFFGSITSLIENFAAKIVNSIGSAGRGIVNFLIAIVIAFYFMKDKDSLKSKLLEFIDLFIPKKTNKIIMNFACDIHAVFSGYIQGVLIDASIVALLISTWLSIVGVGFAIIIGVISGFSNIIPYIGAIVGFVLGVLAAFLTGNPTTALWAGVGIIIIQQIDGMFIQPKVVGQNVKISPVLVLLSLSIAGTLFGLLGMILAVPVCAVIKMFIIRFIDRQKENTIKNK